jgi:hypothetical protein
LASEKPAPDKTAKTENQPTRVWAWLTGQSSTAKQPAAVAANTAPAAKTPETPAPDPAKALPPGGASLAAASVPRPATPEKQDNGLLMSAPNAFSVRVPPPPDEGMPGSMMAQGGGAEDMANAFSTAGNYRPIPTDMGRSYQIPNAFPAVYQGGAVPAPWPVMRVGYVVQPNVPAMPPAMVPVMPQQMSGQSAYLLTMLRGSIMPSERELAAEHLSLCDWRYEPQVVNGLVQSAQMDPAPAVRASCIRALARMRVNTMPVVTAVKAMKSDSDIRVRQEVEQALAIMSAQ